MSKECPVEKLIRDAFKAKGLKFTEENDPVNERLDFHLTDFGVHVEVKQFHTDRISEQMSRVQSVIAIQGMQAAKTFVRLIGCDPSKF